MESVTVQAAKGFLLCEVVHVGLGAGGDKS